MQYREDKRANRELSVLGYGCMRFPRRGGAIDQAAAEECMKHAIDMGVNYFDTAYIYPGSEAAVGKFLAKGYRDKVYVATKLPPYLAKSVEDAERILNTQLKRLMCEKIDYYLIHMLPDTAVWKSMCDYGIEKWLDDKRREGKIDRVGFSFHGSSEAFIKLLDIYDWDFCQIQYNYLDENAQAGRRGLEYAQKKGIPVIIMEPLRGGRLARLPKDAQSVWDKAQPQLSAAQWALRYVWNHSGVTVLLSGMNALAQIDENCAAADMSQPSSLCEDDLKNFDAVRDILGAQGSIGCTGCGYCMPCPANVDIPTAFRAYNARAVDGKAKALKEYIMCTTLKREKSYASLCKKCGLCKKKCPQGIDIPNELVKVKKTFEGVSQKVSRIGAHFMFK